jgi:ATP-binding cassette subfamily F protein 3
MAVLIATNLRKELSGSPLFDGVSFKLERRDRLALAGANGAGKTTLLRALQGEITLEGGELAWEKGTRVALHDQRPPAGSSRPLRDYVLAGTADLAAVEEELRTLEADMASGTYDARTLSRYAGAQARLEHAGGYDWRERASAVVRGRRSPARLRRSRTCCCSTSRRTTSTSSRSSGSRSCCARSTQPSSSSRTTAGSSRR